MYKARERVADECGHNIHKFDKSQGGFYAERNVLFAVLTN
jgi:hypothetical protein